MKKGTPRGTIKTEPKKEADRRKIKGEATC